MTVKHRHIYYVSGFDPRGASFYYRLYRKEAAKQADAGGLNLRVDERERHSGISSRWQVHTEIDGQTVTTTYECLHWDDIIRTHWVRSELAVLLNYLKSFWIYSTSGTLRQVLKISWPPFVTSVTPLVGLVGLTLLAAGLIVTAVKAVSTPGMALVTGMILTAVFGAGMRRIRA